MRKGLIIFDYERGRQEAIKEVLEWLGWLQSTALIDSPDYFTTSIDNWETLKKEIATLQEKK